MSLASYFATHRLDLLAHLDALEQTLLRRRILREHQLAKAALFEQVSAYVH